ncbi:hypothetical protein BKA62DRAFT_757642 [Auriculariales sp. MPI-PUGE-AT-0066]|nr:hypothetical protein BKA62DRAFT_757642 [Auriculariales sp. MPI-PUGE-AT-0066]
MTPRTTRSTMFTTLTTLLLLANAVHAELTTNVWRRAAAHNYSVELNDADFNLKGNWGAFDTLLPIEGCPDWPMTTTADPDASITYKFKGTALYATLLSRVSGSTDCTGVLTIDGKAHDIAVPPQTSTNGDGFTCTTVRAPVDGSNLDGKKNHQVELRLNGQADRTRCPFIFMRFQVTTTSDDHPADPTPSDTGSAGPTGTDSSTSSGTSASTNPSGTTTNTNGQDNAPSGSQARRLAALQSTHRCGQELVHCSSEPPFSSGCSHERQKLTPMGHSDRRR